MADVFFSTQRANVVFLSKSVHRSPAPGLLKGARGMLKKRRMAGAQACVGLAMWARGADPVCRAAPEGRTCRLSDATCRRGRVGDAVLPFSSSWSPGMEIGELAGLAAVCGAPQIADRYLDVRRTRYVWMEQGLVLGSSPSRTPENCGCLHFYSLILCPQHLKHNTHTNLASIKFV